LQRWRSVNRLPSEGLARATHLRQAEGLEGQGDGPGRVGCAADLEGERWVAGGVIEWLIGTYRGWDERLWV
jgi:hypothetical protein